MTTKHTQAVSVENLSLHPGYLVRFKYSAELQKIALSINHHLCCQYGKVPNFSDARKHYPKQPTHKEAKI